MVYGRPAIAVPVKDLRVHATFIPEPHPGVRVHLPDIGQQWEWPPGPEEHPIVVVIERLAQLAGKTPRGRLRVASTIPIAAGLGSSAAVAVAVTRVLALALDLSLPLNTISEVAFEAEKVTHGTPSGVDNTVVTYEQPVWFVPGALPEPFPIARTFTLIIAHSGIQASTREVVAAVRQGWEHHRAHYEARFDKIAKIVQNVRSLLEKGDIAAVGPLLTENHTLLQELGVSSPVLDTLVEAALKAGAWGAKLAGAGRGGNIVILAPEERIHHITAAVRQAGAQEVWVTTVEKQEIR